VSREKKTEFRALSRKRSKVKTRTLANQRVLHPQIATRTSGLSARERRGRVSENAMKKKVEKRVRRDELRREYELSKWNGGVRGKYIERYRAGTNLVLLSPDAAKHFPDEQSVNQALRGLIQAAKGTLRRGH
jgi:hypothetical protein